MEAALAPVVDLPVDETRSVSQVRAYFLRYVDKLNLLDVAAESCRNYRLIFYGVECARRVDQTTTLLEKRETSLKDFELQGVSRVAQV